MTDKVDLEDNSFYTKYQDGTEEKPKAAQSSDAALLEEAHERFNLVSETENPQRTREHEDLLFQVPELQWTDVARQERAGLVDGAQKFPPRPMLSVSLLDQPVKLVKNKASKARFGINIHPVDEEANGDLAEVKQGLIRRIERDSNAPHARLWAFERALLCGRGWYRVDTKYDEDASDPWDQEIIIKRILYQDTVYMDPSAQEMDCSDGEWAFVANWVPLKAFKRKFPKSKFANLDQDFAGLQQLAPKWVRSEGKEKAVLVAEYFYKEHNYKTVQDGDRKRETDEVTVWWCNITGGDVLDRQKWNGKYIPLIPVVGRQLQPFDGEVRSEGMVRPARDGQRAFNHAISSVVEDVSRLSKAPYVGAEGQFEGHEQQWLNANLRNQPYVEYRPLDVSGKPAPPPQPMQIDGQKMQLSAQLAEMAKSFVQSATAFYDPSLGIQSRREKSGRAVLAEQQQGDDSTADYLDNLAYAMRYEAKVTLDLMKAIYDREGRITQVLGKEDDEPKAVMLNAPFTMDMKTQRPRMARPGQQGAKFHDMAQGGNYAIAVDIGQSRQTRLEAGRQFMTDVISAAPDLMPVIGDLVFRFRDDPGAKEIAERLKRRIQATMPGIVDDSKQGSPDQLQAENAGLKQQLQVLQQHLQEAGKAIETDQAKQQAHVTVEQIKAQTQQSTAQIQLEIARMNNAAKIEIARITAAKEASNATREDYEESIALGLQQAHEADQANQDRAHEAAMAQVAAGQQADQAQQDRTHEAELGTMGAEPQPPGGGA